ncbi:glycosyltransferase, partial [Campylobacter sp. 2018MI01]|uniref:capsular polysaccharide export protein, LipB/KpsS family n=1 Tax=Campylobacter sp. 2018MI01 TaxID=2836735 RepID=UPI001BD9D85B
DSIFGLSIIIPIGIEEKHNLYILKRLQQLVINILYYSKKYKNIEIIISESGSLCEIKNQIIKISNKYNIKYNLSNSIFQLSETRNNGSLIAKYSHITFIDVDLRISENFFKKLFQIIEELDMKNNKAAFFTLPVYYLNKNFTEYYIKHKKNISKIISDITKKNKKRYIENFSPASSVIIVNKVHFYSVGGYNTIYKGHAFEDFDLMYRLLAELDQIKKPKNVLKDYRTWDIKKYDGLRAYLSKTGEQALKKQLYTIHLWHSRPKIITFYKKNNNRSLYKKIFKEFDKTLSHPIPLSPINNNILFIGKIKTPAFNCLKDFIPYLGKVIEYQEKDFFYNNVFDDKKFKIYIKKYNIHTILFTNPYGNAKRLAIYNCCKKKNIPFYCFDRGALPDSWFLDHTGFNYDSILYKNIKKLNQIEICETKQYINDILENDNYLEIQSRKIGAELLKKQLNIKNKKILFVPLQRKNDTVIKYFSGHIKSIAHFCSIIDKLAQVLYNKNWIVIVKEHPLENSNFMFKNAILLDNKTNFLDCLELCDKVAVINSGVGIYAMMMNKPCYIFGNAFYELNGVNIKITNLNLNSISQKLNKPFFVNEEKAVSFIYLLKNNIYSYAKSI